MIGTKRQRQKEAAVHFLRIGKPEEALAAALHLGEEDPTDAEAFQIQGLAHARLGEAEAASQALRQAVKLSPNEGKHHYNLASHLANIGEMEEARKEATEAVRVAPGHTDAIHLLDVLEGRAELKAQTPHLLPWMRGKELLWNRVGQGIMALATVVAISMFVHPPAAPTGKQVPKGQLPDVALRTDSVSQLLIFLLIASAFATFVWMIVDIVDRRKRFSWIVPLLICGMMGLNIVPLAMYFFIGRRIDEVGVPKA